ncbi:hypothetical protein ACKWTF_014476 [Chironomus riparius]
MKLIKFLTLLTSVSLTFCSDHATNIDLIAITVTSLVEKFFIEQSIYFEILIYGKRSDHLSDVIYQFLYRMNLRSIGVYLRNIQEIFINLPISVRHPLVVFMLDFDTLESFRDAARYHHDELKVDMKILIYVDEDIQLIPTHRKFKFDTVDLVAYFYYIRNEKYHITFFTQEYFNENRCNEPYPVTINSMNKQTMRWKTPLRNYYKFHNFHGCELVLVEKFGTFFNFVNRNQKIIDCILKNRSYCKHVMSLISQEEQPQGLFVDFFKMTSKIANFTPKFKLEVSEDMTKPYIENEKNPIVELLVGPFNKSFGFQTSLLFKSSFVIAATPSDFYTNYEKLWLPFDDVTWVLLLITFLSAFLVIFLAKFLTNSIKSLIIGREVMTPGLNVLQVFFGISQMKLPDSSVPRFILMLFIGFCLIFRTCYQSELFEFMTSDMRKPPPSTIEDLVERNYKILTCDQGHLLELMQIIHGDEAW